MRKSGIKILSIIIVFLHIGLTSCMVSAPVDQPIVTPEMVTIATISLTETPKLLESPTNPPISTPTVDPTETAISLAMPTLSDAEFKPRICSEPPSRFNFRQQLSINGLANLRFESENLLTFEGWTQRPEPLITPITPEPTPDMRPEPNTSDRILLIGGQLTLSDGLFNSRPLDFDAPINNLCREKCPMEVISQSPDGDWQLIQVSDWVREKMGIWLVSENEMTRLVPYVSGPWWQWAEDSSLLWFESGTPNDLGGDIFLIQPDSPTIITETEDGSLLDPLLYYQAFSPLDKTALSVPSFEQGFTRNEEIYKIELTQSITQPVEVQSIFGIVSVAWNEVTKNYLIQVVGEDGIKFLDLSGNILITIPYKTLESVIPALENGQNELSFGLGRIFALSPSNKYLAIVHSPGELWLFDCN